MDKETLSHYGWIVIILIILAIMISLATPFATEIKNSIKYAAINMVGIGEGVVEDLVNKYSPSDNDVDGAGNKDEKNENGSGENKPLPTIAVSSPEIALENTVLVITNNQGDAESFKVYDGEDLLVTVASMGITTKYDLLPLESGTHEIKVAGCADDMLDSETASVTYIVDDYGNYKPTAVLNFKSLTITEDGIADYYRVFVNGVHRKTIIVNNNESLKNIALGIEYGDVVSVSGYKNKQQIGSPIVFTSTESNISIKSVSLDSVNVTVVCAINNWDAYYNTSATQLKVYINGTIYKSITSPYLYEYNYLNLDGVTNNGDEIRVDLIIDGIMIDTQLVEINNMHEDLRLQLPSPVLSVNGSTLYFTDPSGIAEKVVVKAVITDQMYNETETESEFQPGGSTILDFWCIEGVIIMDVYLTAEGYIDSEPATIRAVIEMASLMSYEIIDVGTSGTIE